MAALAQEAATAPASAPAGQASEFQPRGEEQGWHPQMGCQASSGKKKAAASDAEVTAEGPAEEESITVVVAEASSDKELSRSQELSQSRELELSRASTAGSVTPEAGADTGASRLAPSGQGKTTSEEQGARDPRLSALSKRSSSSGKGRSKVPRAMGVVKRK
ncbi:unnamed protein product [Prorocentrum cordatum]|uniref:Uncharacterized protein n=1 Tax=Prorocentrum cordatum TaxID=2364126 RepID=A0ABN9PXE2_9DINO|nr:unnamed protein product [Polarella glacialis]